MSNKGTCKAEGCEKDVRAKGYCDSHYRAWKKGKMGKPRHHTCNKPDCNKVPFQRGVCEEHFAADFGKKRKAREAAAAAAAVAPAENAAAEQDGAEATAE